MVKLFIFGSTGDLVKRKVLPALKKIKNLEVYAIGRRNLTTQDYKKQFNTKLNIHYLKLDFEQKDFCLGCLNFLDKKETNYIFLALPPALQEKILEQIIMLKQRNLKLKILIEKPFGHNLESALHLNSLIVKEKLENDVFISDHYLFKKQTYNLKPINFKNLRIISLEKLGLAGRIHYDEVGALRDMIQSHFLNITFKLLNNPAEEFSKIEILSSSRAQYKNYEKDLGKKSDTETYVHLIMKTKTKILEFETGKAFKTKKSFIEIDGRKTNLTDSPNPYTQMFLDFFSNNKESFPKHTLLAWRILEKIQKTPLERYS